MKRFVLGLLLAFSFSAPSAAQRNQARDIESRVRLRPVDRATVRIIAIGGARAVPFEGRRTRLARVAAIGAASHGSGVSIGASLVLTAAHVVRGADLVAVLPTGGNQSLPTTVVYVDPEHDVAILHVGGELPAALALPSSQRTMEIAERLYATGFPIDVQQRYPAAVSGELSRENNDGSLQVAMSVNGGNSGGPVLDRSGALVGIVTSRGEPRAGVVGIAFLEPLRFILPAVARARAAIARVAPSYTAEDRKLAQIAADFVRTSDERPSYEQTSVATLSSAVSDVSTPEGLMLVAAHAWNMRVALLEDRNAPNLSALNGAERRTARWLVQTAVDLSERALRVAPHILVRYSAARAIVALGRPMLQATTNPAQTQVAAAARRR